VEREMKTWKERRQRGNSDVIGQYGKKKFPLFFDSMTNFFHNVANRTSKFLQYVLVVCSILTAFDPWINTQLVHDIYLNSMEGHFLMIHCEKLL
jgi:hypothetical protein